MQSVARSFENAPRHICLRVLQACGSVAAYVVSVNEPYARVAAKTCASEARAFENAPSKICSRMLRASGSVAT